MGGISEVHIGASDDTREQILCLFVVQFSSPPIDMPAEFAVFDHCSASGFELVMQLTFSRLVTRC
jgi:hypothetical protein